MKKEEWRYFHRQSFQSQNGLLQLEIPASQLF
jgi:hypothetical protein